MHIFSTENSRPKPFLKWAGGKKHLLSGIRSLITKEYGKYIEPFVGGGALFFDICPARSILSDSNVELVNCYKIVRDYPDELLTTLESMPVSKEQFYAIRKQTPESLSCIARAARLIYLNKTCYNGLYRVNKKGYFNTPFGKYNLSNVADRTRIYAASKALQKTNLLEGDFEKILLEHAKAQDFVYLDPPYPSVGKYADFKRYTKDFFSEEDHIRLAKMAAQLDNVGCTFVLSNAKHPLIEELYSSFRKINVEAPRFINCRGGKRGNVPELLITNIKN